MRRIEPAKRPLRGELRVPGDKSIGHRAVIFASVAEGRSRIHNLSGGEDNRRTVQAFKDMGVEIGSEGDALCIEGRGWNGLSAPARPIDCGNSGTTMRLLSGLLGGRPFASELDGDASLRRRPMQRVIEPLSAMGARIVARGAEGRAPLHIDGGPLTGIDYAMPIASAQVKSAILLAGLQADGRTRTQEPQRSRDHTELMIKGFGGSVEVQCRAVSVAGHQRLSGREVLIPGDISSAAFFMVAAAIVPGSDVLIRDVGVNRTRAGVLEILRRMGANIELLNGRVETGEPVADVRVRGGALKGVSIEPAMSARTIDEYPILAVAAAAADGVTTMSGVRELRYKESDRIASMSEGLMHLGVSVEAQEDGMVITGGKPFTGARVRSHGDHRVAMSLAVAALAATGAVEIDDVECVAISFPPFFELLGKICLH
jgi:3-phosphoshikimate 1-carboxyvinyltransferase